MTFSEILDQYFCLVYVCLLRSSDERFTFHGLLTFFTGLDTLISSLEWGWRLSPVYTSKNQLFYFSDTILSSLELRKQKPVSLRLTFLHLVNHINIEESVSVSGKTYLITKDCEKKYRHRDFSEKVVQRWVVEEGYFWIAVRRAGFHRPRPSTTITRSTWWLWILPLPRSPVWMVDYKVLEVCTGDGLCWEVHTDTYEATRDRMGSPYQRSPVFRVVISPP